MFPGVEITAGHHCEERLFRVFSAYSAENTLKSLSSTVMTGRYFDPWFLYLYFWIISLKGKSTEKFENFKNFSNQIIT